MKLLAVWLLLACACTAKGQYYFNDIIGNQQSNLQFRLLKANHISGVKAFSYNNSNKLTDSFNIEQNLTEDGNVLVTITEIPNTAPSTLISYFQHNSLIGTINNVGAIETKTQYSYNTDSLLQQIHATTKDTVYRNYNSSETHIWQYNTAKKPMRMLKIKNSKDTTVVEFKLDSAGNVAEEHWFTNNRETEVYYYYYNPRKQLTDIVRYHLKIQKMIADYLFEYDAAGKISQMSQLTAGGTGYLVWKYAYLANGLKERETCSNQNDVYIGRIEYGYQKQP